jgi:N4-gp56 family major capsid protein
MAVFDNLNYSYAPKVSPVIVQYHERAALKNMQPELVHCRDAQKRTLPEHNGKSVKFHRYTPFGAITKPLVEGVTPPGQTLEATDFSVMVKPYGGHVEITDELNLYVLNDMHSEINTLLTDQASLSLDTISRNALNAGMNVQYAGANTSRGTVTPQDVLTYMDIKKCVRNLKRRLAKPFADGFYHAIVHTDVVYDLTGDKEHWIDVATYQDKQKIEKYELGCAYKVKFFESTNAMVFKAAAELIEGVASIAANADFDAATKTLTTATKLTADQARALTGLLVNVEYTSGGTKYVAPMCVESVDYEAGKIKFRWAPADTAAWTSANALKVVPYGGGAGGAPVYSTLVYGQDAFGTVELGGNGRNFSIIINPPGSAGAADPLAQRGTMAWKVKGFCTAIIQDDFITRIESGASA